MKRQYRLPVSISGVATIALAAASLAAVEASAEEIGQPSVGSQLATAASANDTTTPTVQPTAGPAPLSKAAAILGGPSQLERVAARQTGSAPAAALTSGAGAMVAARDGSSSIIGFSPTMVIARPSSAQATGLQGLPVARPWTTSAPDLFGTTAIEIGQSPLQRRWREVKATRAAPNPQWASLVRTYSGESFVDRLHRINASVNARITFTDDAALYGRRDYWASAAESLGRGRGDCEDYAIAKMQLLRSIGVPAEDLYLVVARDLVRRADHALLVVRVGDQALVLDNNTDMILEATQVRDYMPIVTYAADRAWTHGRRIAPPTPVLLASAP